MSSLVPRKYAVALAFLFSIALPACDLGPLFAPIGSTLTLSSITLPGGSLRVVARVTEASGTAPHSGTRIFFSTTLGEIEPWGDTDDNGQAQVAFSPGSTTGTATVTASSGSVTTGTAGALKITIEP